MISFVNPTTTAQTPSGFAMPTCGHASIPASIRAWIPAAVIVRDRQEGSVRPATLTVLGATTAIKRDAATPAYFPGTTAWRPPIC
ncbi:hypothetical protein [Nocardioides marmotae]|uniref:Uncharacterized protein n=1 Tax=Nocardioides marmotae TaxID=2663857 RepID=A0A6I3J0W7_9ACTN|nr:hypothetical protein [Nocardioides marmotae]MCR6031518.1 hypothetical protein [Gordonia jinghuaiqii]MBC9733326.1 hypothetical protein [Nocardioides marmotae]MTB84433.1 hypothetical protein [Nocardioides marmotae]MTB95157.1 hypothetical protein [Nocardioides marmotae]QKE02357.1 hypothetical protein HPC71_15750 [Nocardioides marmotae]